MNANTEKLKMELLEFLKVNRGIKHKVDRKFLAAFLNISDRMVRRLIADLRTGGEPIISHSKSKGYWYYDRTVEDCFEADIMIRETFSRIKQLKRMISPIERVIYGHEQILIDFKTE